MIFDRFRALAGRTPAWAWIAASAAVGLAVLYVIGFRDHIPTPAPPPAADDAAKRARGEAFKRKMAEARAKKRAAAPPPAEGA